MKHSIAIVIISSLLANCNSPQPKLGSSYQELGQQQAELLDCPDISGEKSKIRPNPETNLFNFNFQINGIDGDQDTITFTSNDHQFTLCRHNQSWTVQNKKSSPKELNNQPRENNTLNFKNQVYKYQVKLDSQYPAQKAIFELFTPESAEPKQQVLYDLAQAQDSGVIELESPQIAKAMIFGDRLFWAIYTYRGEGFGGITSIVSYDPATEDITVIQPPELTEQIVNDLVITGNTVQPTFWLATQLTGEGNPYIPSLGLVAYQPTSQDLTQGNIKSFRVNNSPLVGAIPTKLHLEQDILWVGTGNGICQVDWQTIGQNKSWNCWRFALMSKIDRDEIPVYKSLLDDAVHEQIQTQELEILWWLPQNKNPEQKITGRFEIKYESGIAVKLTDFGAMSWTEYYGEERLVPSWLAPVHWPGSNWHWHKNRFIRSFDEVELNLVGGGEQGISINPPNNDYIFDMNVIRGDLQLSNLNSAQTSLKHYSAWVDDHLLEPYLTIIPVEQISSSELNPLIKIQQKLN